MLDESIQFFCNWCGESVLLTASQIEWDMWYSANPPHVQRCFPTMSADDREMLVSGTCPTCWDNMFGGNS